MSDANIIEINGIVVNLEDAKARKDIENLSLAIGKDGLLYIKKQDGALIGTGVNVSSGTDLSNITMSLNANTLILSNNGSQIASVDLYKIVKRGVTENTYGTLGTDNKTIIGGINEINSKLKDVANISLTIGNDGLLYIKKQDGTLIGTGINISSSDGGSADLSKITMRVENNKLILLNNNLQIASVDLPSSINSDEVSSLIGKGVSETTYNTLGTDNKTIIGGINEVKDNQLILVTDDTSMQGISDSKHDTLETNDKTIIGGINEVNRKVKTYYNTIEKEISSYFEPVGGDVNIFKQDEYLIGYHIENSNSHGGYSILRNSVSGKGKIAVVKIKPNTKYSIIKENKPIADDNSKLFIYATDSALFNQGDNSRKIDGTYGRLHQQNVTFTSTATDNYLYIYFSDDKNATDYIQVTEGERTDFITYNPSDKLNVYSTNEVDEKLRDIPSLFSTEQTDEYYKIKYNNIVIATIPLGKGSVTPTPTTKYSITNNLSHATNSNTTTSIAENTSYSANITANSNYKIKTVTVTMGGVDITNTAYSNGRINISSVTGNIVITVTTEYVSSEITRYTITNNLSHATNSNTTTSIEENASYNATITANSNYRIKNVTVTMGSTNVTNSVYSNGRINIPNVTGNITITVTTEAVTTTTTYTVINSLTNCSINNTTRIVNENSPYTAIITPREGCVLSTATITMGGVDITSSAYNNGVINIRQVTGDIVITVTAIETTTPVEPPVDPDLDGLLKNRLLVWHDEFDGQTLDTNKWRYATHNSGGSEQQAYTMGRTENVRLENSKLILEAHKDSYKSGWTWSSGRIDTCGLAGFKYGRLEAKLRYDVVSGAFPAFWTIGTCAYYPTGENVVGVKKSLGTQWAQNGELDMFEGRGTNKIISQGGWYNQDDGKGNQSLVVGEGKNIDANEYHVYAFEWTPTTITAYIDGVETGTKDITNIKSWQRPMYLILNMAVGSVGGYPADDCTSIKMEVDWVRVYAPVGVTAKEEVQSISLTQNNVSFNVGDDPIDVYYTVNPSTAWDNNVNYESSNPNVAEVYGSRIYPKGIGSCKITARATNGVTATINVTVAQNASINSSSITLDKDTLEIYSGTNSTLIATATPPNHTDSILWKSSNDTIATVANGVVTGKNIGNCTITAYSSANSSVKAECSVAVKEAVQLTGHPTSGLTLQLDRNGMSSTSWRNAIDNTQLQWKVATNNSTDIASYMVFNGDSFYWAGANYKDHLTLSGFSNYYDFGESQTVILAGDFTNGVNPILSNKQKLSQNTNTAFIQGNSVSYSNADGTKLGSINAKDGTYNIDGCISLRYNKQTLRVDCDKMAFTDSAVTNMNTTLSSAFSQGTYPALLGNVSTAKIYWKVVLVYNRVLTNTEIETAMKAIKTFLNS